MILWSARDANKVEKCSSLTKIALTNEYMIRHFRRRIKAVNYSTANIYYGIKYFILI